MGKGVLIDMKNSLKTFMLDDFSGFGDLDTSLAEKITSRQNQAFNTENENL